MKIKTAELTGPALDWAVAKASGHYMPPMDEHKDAWFASRRFSTDWAQAGPIIEREAIELVPDGKGSWSAAIRGGDEDDVAHGPTPLIAAMRCFVASRLGDEVGIPEELT
jgi:hypothetical protein